MTSTESSCPSLLSSNRSTYLKTTSWMIFCSSLFSLSSCLDFSSSLLLVDEPVFMVSWVSDCHSPRVISLRIYSRQNRERERERERERVRTKREKSSKIHIYRERERDRKQRKRKKKRERDGTCSGRRAR